MRLGRLLPGIDKNDSGRALIAASAYASERSKGLADRLLRDLGGRLFEPLLKDRDHFLWRLHDIEFELEAFADEFLRAHMVDERDEGRPVIIDVADDDRL